MKSKTRSVVKTIFYNALFLFVFGNVLYWSIPTVVTLINLRKYSESRITRFGIPPAYSSTEATWVKRHWVDMNRRKTVYRSYVGWRTDAMKSETINIELPYLQRKTVNEGTSGQRKAYFFGGSTMWGVGDNDAGTIPSQFAALTGIHSENFGELSYTAHQGLVLLIQLLQDGHRPDLVVFYDGVNEVVVKCRIEVSVDANDYDPAFRKTFQRSFRTDSFSYYFAPLVVLAEKINLEIARATGTRAQEFACHRDRDKAEAIAERMISDWQIAKQLVESYGGTFVGLLQPVAYQSRTQLDRVPMQGEFEPQFRAVYPIIRKKISGMAAMYDLTSALDKDEYVYIDFCHLAPKGNRYIAQRIAEVVGSVGSKQ